MFRNVEPIKEVPDPNSIAYGWFKDTDNVPKFKVPAGQEKYHLPPSPSRPAPVLDRGTGPAPRAATLQREPGPPRRPARTSVSEGELTDDVSRQERVVRQRNKFLSNLLPGRRVSVDREPGLVGRKAVAGQETLQRPQSRSGERVVRRPAPQPPAQLRRGSVEVGETSHSETESPRPAEVGPVLSNSNQLTA